MTSALSDILERLEKIEAKLGELSGEKKPSEIYTPSIHPAGVFSAAVQSLRFSNPREGTNDVMALFELKTTESRVHYSTPVRCDFAGLLSYMWDKGRFTGLQIEITVFHRTVKHGDQLIQVASVQLREDFTI